MTGKTSLFDVAIKNADFICETLGTKISPSFAHNPSAVMGLAEMYRETGKQKYLDCAKLIVDSRGENPQEKNTDSFPLMILLEPIIFRTGPH